MPANLTDAMKRGYQHNFSRLHAGAMHNREGRLRKARTMVAVLKDFFETDLDALTVLDLGASTGIISHFLAQHAHSVVGADIDRHAIDHARSTYKKSNLTFMVDDAMHSSLRDGSFDVVVCAQIYEHVPDAARLMAGIYRLLKQGGVCYFAAGNRLALQEAHYGLPLLSVIPRPLAHLYVRLAGRGTYYYEKHLSCRGLRGLVRAFAVHDYTRHIIHNPEKFHAGYMLPEGQAKSALARFIVDHLYWLCPGYIWLLQKSPAADGCKPRSGSGICG